MHVIKQIVYFKLNFFIFRIRLRDLLTHKKIIYIWIFKIYTEIFVAQYRVLDQFWHYDFLFYIQVQITIFVEKYPQLLIIKPAFINKDFPSKLSQYI